jgi:hypothetical protein
MRRPKKSPTGGKCWAGRLAFNDGNPDWRQPCQDPMKITHVVTAFEDIRAPEIELCNRHYLQVLAQGLITEPDPTKERLEEFKLRSHGIFKV